MAYKIQYSTSCAEGNRVYEYESEYGVNSWGSVEDAQGAIDVMRANPDAPNYYRIWIVPATPEA